MNQLAIDFQPRVRRSDPETSYKAAEKAKSFSGKHRAAIYGCLKDFGPMTPSEISEKTGLDYHAVQRRGREMEEGKLIIRYGERDGQKIWEAI